MKIKINNTIVESDFFNNFNWDNFSLGDIVWLDDYYGVSNKGGYFVGIEEDTVQIKLLNYDMEFRAFIFMVDNIHELIGS